MPWNPQAFLNQLNLGKVKGGKRPSLGRGTDRVFVDLSDDHVRIVYGKETGGHCVIVQVAERQFGENAEAEMSQFLDDFFVKNKIKSKRVICAVQSKSFISKNVDIPSSDDEEIRKIIDLQAGRYTPYSRDEIVIDYLSIEKGIQHYTNVLLVIIHRDVTDKYFQIFDRVEIDIEKIFIVSEGMAPLYSRLAGDAADQDAVGGIHFSEKGSDLTILDKQKMVFVRSLPIGASHFRENRETAKDNFLSELHKSIMAYQDQGVGKPVKMLILTGLIGELNFLEEAIQNSPLFASIVGLSIQKVDYRDSFELAEEATPSLEATQAVSFFDLMACFSSEARMHVDLIPKEIKLKHHVREGGRDALTLGSLIMTCLLMVCIFLATKIYLLDQRIKKIDEYDQETFEEARALERTSTKSRVLRNLLDNRGKGLYVFERVTSLISPEIYLTHFSYDSEGDLRLAGTAGSMSQVYALVNELEESNYFQSVDPKETKSRRAGDKEVADFQIECLLAEGI